MYDSYANQRNAVDNYFSKWSPQAQFGPQPNQPSAGALAQINTPRQGQAGGYYDAQGNYRTGLNSNPAVIAGRQTIQAGQDAMRASGGFNGPGETYAPGFDPFLATGNVGPSSGGGVMNNLPNTINNTQNQYNNGQYTGFGGSVLSASGNPSYNGGQSNGGPGGGGSGGSPSNPANVPNYYAGMPQSNTRPTVMRGYTPSTQYPGAIAPPLMPNLNRETRSTYAAPVAPPRG